ncbi:MAG: dTDP-4-dehydrorhamnose reductase [Candidatus Bathyarchaeota archaeon]|nr:dTDP-4-dehydrorhamnose reductase [Candidatus Bathyarchaeota archaeon]
MKIVIIGSTGQLGTDLMEVLKDEYDTVGLTHQDIEVTDHRACQIIKDYHPGVVINTAAFHKTDQCEEDPARTFSVNAIGARNIASVSREIEAVTVFISTDYVFDGSANKPYTEKSVPNPVNTYGISKLAGELYTKQNLRHYVVRVSSLFGLAGASGKGGNFVETMIAKAKKGDPISVVDDMWMSPTYTKDAALTIKKMLRFKLPFGTYHATNYGYCTWFEFAEEIFKLTCLTPVLTRIKTCQLQAKAKRPQFSALKSLMLPKYDIKARSWKKALHDYLIAKGHVSH